MIKTDWKARLKSTLIEKEKTAGAGNSQLTKADKTKKSDVSSVYVSAELRHKAGKYEKVFDVENKTGSDFIRNLYETTKKHEATGRPFINLNQPTLDALEAEINLVDGIKQREIGQISEGALQLIVSEYITTHSVDADLSKTWATAETPLYYLRLLLNGEEIEAYTCNPIQAEIISALWQTTNPEAIAKAFRL